MRVNTILLGLAAISALLLPGLSRSSQPESFQASYSLEFRFPEAPATTQAKPPTGAPPSKPLQIPPIPGEGTVYWADPNLRVDFTNGFNQETMRLLINFDTGKAVMLYPDTKNGYRTDLKAMDKQDYLSQTRDFLSKGGSESTPTGFTKKVVGSETIKGVKCTRTKYTKEGGTQVNVWRNKAGDPVKFSADATKGHLVVNITEFKSGVKLKPALFAIDKSYKLKDTQDPPSEFSMK